MTVESAVYINTLNSSLPSGLDAKSEGDDHLRLVKTVLKATFPNVAGAANPSHTELNALVGITGSVVGTTNSQTLTNKTLASPGFTGTPALTGPVNTTLDYSVSNSSNGTGATAAFQAFNDAGKIGEVLISSSGYTAYSVLGANGTMLYGNGAGGVLVNAADAAGTIRFAAGGGTEQARFDASGNFLLGGTTVNFGAAGRQVVELNGTSDSIVAFKKAGVSQAYVYADSGGNLNVNSVVATLLLQTANSTRLQISAAGVIADGAGNELGFKGLPAASVTTGAFIASDRGKCVFATGGVTVPNAVMSAGDVVVIQDESGSAQTITASIGTLRQTGTTNTGSRTLKAFGRAAIVFKSGTLAYISGDLS